MVVFTCNNCGETLQKPKVAKHYEFKCHTSPFLTCVDCFKDFRGEEYVAHTKCVTEAERYGGKDYVPKLGANKGEKKQQQWINVVNNILNGEASLSKAEKSFLHILSKFENIPRKKTKFLNFVKSAVGQRTNPEVVNSVWDKMETAYKSNAQNVNQETDKVNEKMDHEKDVNAHQEINVIENQNNENLDRENQNGDQQNKNDELNGNENGTSNNTVSNVQKKKSKKRKMSEGVQEQTQEPDVKKESKQVAEVAEERVVKKKKKHVATEELVPTKENEDISLNESSISQCNDSIEKSDFNWKDTIISIVKKKEEIPLKKLQKKVVSLYMNSCSDAVSYEKACSKFIKKLKKVRQVVATDEKVSVAYFDYL